MSAVCSATHPELPQPEPRPSPLAWVLHDGKAGMASQSVGLAEATGFSFAEKPLEIRLPWSWLPPSCWVSPLAAVRGGRAILAPPWPDLVIACGRQAAVPALAIRRASGGTTIAAQIQDPRIGRAEFDVMFVPEHDRLRGDRVFVTRGALHRVTAARLAAERGRFAALRNLPRPIFAVLIGGNNRAYRLSARRLGEIADAVAKAARAAGGSVLVTPSRRTGAHGIELLRRGFRHVPGAVWDGTGENPYYAYLASADAVLVTADSISMVSEAAATGKPVHILDLDGGDAKFARFHAAMRAAGVTRSFSGEIESWSYAALDETRRAGEALRALVLRRLASRAR
ncbi:MAG: mitochondrial fission ELM1 family protein [Alphaproteobacteria bacterium]|nr:mitochondrial fission ELM1 family protein [Alphaproteobacteria bacterium]